MVLLPLVFSSLCVQRVLVEKKKKPRRHIVGWNHDCWSVGVEWTGLAVCPKVASVCVVNA